MATMENWLQNVGGSDSNTDSNDLQIEFPFTSEFNSLSFPHKDGANCFPISCFSKKKLPEIRSCVTTPSSIIVNFPIPGRIKFLSSSEPVEVAFTKQMCDNSSRSCPEVSQRRSCLSYLVFLSISIVIDEVRNSETKLTHGRLVVQISSRYH